jgi:putative sterol carrier protein
MAMTSVKEVFDNVSQRFNPNAAKGMDAVCQFNITGEGGGNWYLVVKQGTCQVHEGTAQNPNVTLTMGSDTWLGMVNKQVNGMQAFMTGKLKVSGDIMLAQRIPDLFSM